MGLGLNKKSATFAQLPSQNPHQRQPSFQPTLLIHSIMSIYVQMMIIDGSERVIWSNWIMVSWIRVHGLGLEQPHLPNFGAKILISASLFSNQHPAHPFHHVLICPDDDNC
jgi:hypothetical protein